jgi:cell division protein FtsN
MTKERTDRTILATVVAAFFIVVIFGAGLSFFTSQKADQLAASSGSSTDGNATNTPADRINNQRPAETTGTNVPSARAPR